MIDFQALSKSYGPFAAVQPLTLTVGRGEVFGFLGPNGAGKTTTIRMMMGILVPSSGRVTIADLDCHTQRERVQQRTGYLPDNPSSTTTCAAVKSCSSWPRCTASLAVRPAAARKRPCSPGAWPRSPTSSR